MPRVISARLDCSCLDRPVSPHTSGFGRKLLLLPSARSPTQGLRGAEHGTKAYQHAGTWLQHRLECGSEEASPSSGGLVRSSILPYKCCSTLPRPGDSGEWLPHVTPPGSRSPLEGPVKRSPHQGFGHTFTRTSLPPGPRPRASGGQSAAQRHTSARARGCSTGWSVGPRRLPPAAEAWFEAPSFPTSAAAPCHGRGTVGSGYPMSHRQAHVRPSGAP